MKHILKCLGGSRAYGLNNVGSDFDYRGIFIDTEINKVIISLDRFEHQQFKAGEQDEFYFELRHYLCSLRKTNSQALELLFIEQESIQEKSWEYDLIVKNRLSLIDVEKLYKSIKGYVFNEIRIAFGGITGPLGSKRKTAIENFGYSPKNVVQALRLMYSTGKLFSKGYFPVNILKEDSFFAGRLMRIKNSSKIFEINELREDIRIEEDILDRSFNNRSFNYKFNEDIANDLCLKIYSPVIQALITDQRIIELYAE